jgi:glutathione synthase
MCFLVADVDALKATFGGVHLGWAAQRRGHDVRFVSAGDVSLLDDNTALASTRRARAGDYARPSDFLAALVGQDSALEEEDLAGFDVVFLRANPFTTGPFEPGRPPVLDLCWRLRLQGSLVVNDPEGLRRALGGMYLADLPPTARVRTLVSRAPEQLKGFLRELDGPAVLKPLAAAGPQQVFYVRRRQAANVNQILTAILRKGYAVAQEYLPAASQGEKRVLLLGGQPLHFGGRTSIYRRPARAALGQTGAGGGAGGSAVAFTGEPRGARAGRRGKSHRPCQFGPAEARLCEMLRPRLLADGLYLATADIVGDRILSLNVFTPGSLHSLREIYGIDAADLVIRDVERRVRLRGAYRGSADPEAGQVV